MGLITILSSKNWSLGPKLPDNLIYPCTVNVNSSLTFIFGRNASNLKDAQNNAFLLDHIEGEWTDISQDIPCPINEPTLYKYSCGFLRTIRFAFVSVENCTAVYDIQSFNWTFISSPLANGVVFNNDEKENSLFLIGISQNGQSELHKVNSSVL